MQCWDYSNGISAHSYGHQSPIMHSSPNHALLGQHLLQHLQTAKQSRWLRIGQRNHTGLLTPSHSSGATKVTVLLCLMIGLALNWQASLWYTPSVHCFSADHHSWTVEVQAVPWTGWELFLSWRTPHWFCVWHFPGLSLQMAWQMFFGITRSLGPGLYDMTQTFCTAFPPQLLAKGEKTDEMEEGFILMRPSW